MVSEHYVRAKDRVQQLREEKLEEIKNELEEPEEDDPDDLAENLVLTDIKMDSAEESDGPGVKPEPGGEYDESQADYALPSVFPSPPPSLQLPPSVPPRRHCQTNQVLAVIP